ncbi:MAG: hypothetical protein KAU38_06220, partial [Desulfobacterales bacterium]|nr:hypothetical protein [Desulfobacterales bacterium]
ALAGRSGESGAGLAGGRALEWRLPAIAMCTSIAAFRRAWRWQGGGSGIKRAEEPIPRGAIGRLFG